ncbi:MAG: hypothetical protein ACREQF_10485 [Candidatus Binataceae bacterium]
MSSSVRDSRTDASSLKCAAVLLFVLALPGCNRAATPVSEPDLRRIIQQYFEREPFDQSNNVSDTIWVEGIDLECRLTDKRQTCVAPVREKLQFLVRAGMLTEEHPSPDVVRFQKTEAGNRYVTTAGFQSENDQVRTGYAVAVVRPLVTAIDSYTVPGVNSEGVTSTTVRFRFVGEICEWAKPYVSRFGTPRLTAATMAHPGTARLDLTNKGWIVNSVGVYWTVPTQ